jgi:hypothetical protein
MVVVGLSVCSAISADPASEAYRRAQESGDAAALVRAQSFLAPPNCYDVNRWHGIAFTRMVNGRVGESRFPFTWQQMDHLKIRKLRERVGLEEMERSSANERELIRRIADWANTRYGHMQPLPFASWDAHEILDRLDRGDAFWCTYKAALFVQACCAAGLNARMLNISRREADGHDVAEVYINQFRKWMLVDPWMNFSMERNGVPLSALEIHDSIDHPEGIILVFGEHGRGTEYWDFRAGKTASIPHADARIPISDDPAQGLLPYYYDVRIILRNDYTTHPQMREDVNLDGFLVPANVTGGDWTAPLLHYTDDRTPPIMTMLNSGDPADFNRPLNEVRVDFRRVSLPGENAVIETRLSTDTPCFSRYHMIVDGKEIPLDGAVYVWKLHEGNNSFLVSSVNALGREGFPSDFALTYTPSIADHSRQVVPTLKNGGFEEADAKDSASPAFWGTITSNAFRYAAFALDSKVKHAGKLSLRVTPARDPQTGLEYAFIVRSASFPVNAARDAVYSLWLRADRENTPVDLALLDTTEKQQGTYSRQVTVGREWKRYELKCRLHNELTELYVGFKVYSGTVWADDAEYREVER